MEAVARVASSTDAYGQVTLLRRPLPPVRPPLGQLAELREQLERAGDRAHTQYDPDLGWSPRPGATSQNGLYRVNAQGIRVEDPSRSFTAKPAGPRIVLLGDSFTYGDNVTYADTWGAQLAERLPGTEVVNLGVGGYGIGQALLRWRKLGRSLQPQQVVFGLQTENAYRSMNVIRLFYHRRSGIPYSKPRLVEEPDGELRVVNVPTLPLEEVQGVLEDPYGWELAPYEGFLPEPDRSSAWARHSRVLGYVWAVRQPDPRRARRAEIREQAISLAARLVAQLAAEVEATGARFTVVHLPSKGTMKRLLRNGTFAEQPLVERVAARHTLIDSAVPLLSAARAQDLDALYDGHYTRYGNGLVADAIAAELPPLR